MVSDLLALASLASKAGDDHEGAKDLSRLKWEMSSIAAKAKKGIFQYPIVFSPGVNDIETAFKIDKFLEKQYAIFTIMSIGLNPKSLNSNLEAYLDAFSAEELNENFEKMFRGDDKGWFIKPVDKQSVEEITENWERSYEDISDEYVFSTESARPSKRGKGNKVNSEREELNRQRERNRRQYEQNQADAERNQRHHDQNREDFQKNQERSRELDKEQRNLNKDQKHLEEEKEKFERDKNEFRAKYGNSANDSGPIDESFGGSGTTTTGAFYDDKLSKISKAAPTIIQMGLLLGNHNSKSDSVDVTLAIKGVPHFIQSWELMSLFEQAIEDKFKWNRFIKLTTGEIKFFRDFVLGIDKAKRDANLYAKLGRHPWYRRLLERKQKRTVKTAIKILERLDLFGIFKGFLTGTGNSLPTTSIVCSVDELTASSKMKYSFLLKNGKVLSGIMTSLSLLCLAVYDPVLKVCHFHLDSFKDPMTVRIDDMSTDSANVEKELVKMMNTMMQRGLL